MEKKLTTWKNSNYIVTISYTDDETKKAKTKVINEYARTANIQGFRAGKAPATLVEQHMNPQYLEMAITETILNKGIQEVLDENKSIKFIGEPYGYQTEKKWDTTTVTFYIDVYPEINTKGSKWESVKMKKISPSVEDGDIEATLLNIRKNYAEYQEDKKISTESLAKLSFEFVDKDWNILNKWTTYLGEPEFNEDKFREKTFKWKAKDDIITLKYEENKLPHVFHNHENKATHEVKITVKDIKKAILPELTDENIKKLIRDENIKTKNDLVELIKKEIFKQKLEGSIIDTVEKYLTDVKATWVSITIPKTILEQEVKTRMNNLKNRFGSQEKVNQYFEALWEEKRNEFIEEVTTAAKESLEKFFILNMITTSIWLDINREKQDEKDPLYAEKAIYEKLTWEKIPSTENTSTKKAVKKTTKKEK